MKFVQPIEQAVERCDSVDKDDDDGARCKRGLGRASLLSSACSSALVRRASASFSARRSSACARESTAPARESTALSLRRWQPARGIRREAEEQFYF